MNTAINPLINDTVQCWGCPVFDSLIGVVSNAAAAVYHEFSMLAIIIFCGFLAFYALFAVWNNLKGGMADPFYQKSIKPVLINSLIVFALLGLGLNLPRFISTISFEPVADMTLLYTQSMLKTDTETVEQKVIYEPKQMSENGFYRPELRNKIIEIMKTSITQFQSYIQLGFAVMDASFSWNALLGIGALLKHIIMFAVGLYLVYGFFKLFLRFCFYFTDVIIYMTYFAFLLPISLVIFSFNNAEGVPDWIKKFGSGMGTSQIKNVINAIVTLASTIITYTVIMVIIAKFFAMHGTNSTELMNLIISGNIFADSISDDNLMTLTLAGCVVLVYVLNFIADKIPQVSQMIMSAFDVAEEKKMGDELADNAFKFTEKAFTEVKKVATTIIGGGDKKEEKKEDKK